MMWGNDPEDLELTIEKRSGDQQAFYKLIEDIARTVSALYLGHSEIKETEESPPLAFDISFAFMTDGDRDRFAERVRMTFPDQDDVRIHGLPKE